MSRTSINFLLDLLLLLIFLAIIWVTLVLRLLFPPGTTAAGYTLWGLSYDAWCDVQFAIFGVIILGVLLHVMMHWSWVCGVVMNRLSRMKGKNMRLDEGNQTLYGVAVIVVFFNILGAGIVAAYFCIQGPTP